MLRTLKRLGWIVSLVAGVGSASAFSLLGPGNEAYQVQDLGLMVPNWGDLGAPKNIGEEYRRNTPVIYYSFDEQFLQFFGSNGVYAIDQAFAILNNLTNVSAYSADLSEFPLEARRLNYRAGALGLLDLKSHTLSLLTEQLGLGDAVRYVWNLHNRFIGGGGCPNDVQYYIVKRNYAVDPYSPEVYSSYVNGVLYSYYVDEQCAPPVPPAAEAVEIAVDPFTDRFTPVTSMSLSVFDLGDFWTGLTRDDVAGLRYLLRQANANIESAGPGTVAFVTNTAPAAIQVLYTSNLTLLASQAFTNDAATLQGLYPNLSVAYTSAQLTNLVTTNVAAYFTNFPWSPVGTPASLTFATNYDTNVAFVYYHTFANVITNTYHASSLLTVLETNIAAAPWGPPNTLVTNITQRTVLTNLAGGDYYIIPTNACGIQILSNLLTKAFSNDFTAILSTNAAGATNATGGTNQSIYSLSYRYWFTNHALAIFPVDCVSNAVARFTGVEKIRFVRRDYDSLINQFFEPVTNFYPMTILTNNAYKPVVVSRVVTQPDILFTSQDMAPGPAQDPAAFGARAVRNLTFNPANALPRLAGPGTIESPTLIAFNRVGPLYYNVAGNVNGFQYYYLDELAAVVDITWGSYDESTNAPVVYPDGSSLQALENMLLMQVTSASLPTGAVGVAYSAALTGSGGQPPYTWALAPLSGGLPTGLALLPNGTLTGTPTGADVYDITVRMTDAGGRHVDRDLVLTIRP